MMDFTIILFFLSNMCVTPEKVSYTVICCMNRLQCNAAYMEGPKNITSHHLKLG